MPKPGGRAQTKSARDEPLGPREEPPEQPGERAAAAWWLSTGRRRHEWQSLRGAGTARFTGTPRRYFSSARPGDPVLIYLSRPDHAIRAVGVITDAGGQESERPRKQAGEARESGDAAPSQQASRSSNLAPPTPAPEPYIEVQYAFEVPNGLPWRAIASSPTLKDAEPVRRRSSGTLFRLRSEEYSALQSLVTERDPELAASFAALDAGDFDGARPQAGPPSSNGVLRETAPTYSPYPSPQSEPEARPASLPAISSLEELEQLTLLPAGLLAEAVDLLHAAGQIVLSGPPGTGKTWLARGLGAFVAGDPSRVYVVQFHPATAYEDFIEGLKPQVDQMGRVTYAVLPGIFVRVCEAARRDPSARYVIVIDEINRAPLARVFGELLYALEYRGPQGAVELAVSGGMEAARREPFFVPPNLLVIGTMNSADRSIALVDYALRRRFRFVELEPSPQVLDRWLMEHGAGAARRRVVLDLFSEVNRHISESLDPDHRLGHAYFMLNPLDGPALDRLWRTAVKPLIAEYFVPPGGELEEYRALFADAIEELGEGPQ